MVVVLAADTSEAVSVEVEAGRLALEEAVAELELALVERASQAEFRTLVTEDPNSHLGRVQRIGRLSRPYRPAHR
jgi:hypothetical protein